MEKLHYINTIKIISYVYIIDIKPLDFFVSLFLNNLSLLTENLESVATYPEVRSRKGRVYIVLNPTILARKVFHYKKHTQNSLTSEFWEG